MLEHAEAVAAGLPPWFWSMCALTFGAVWGSFLNVVIYRVPRRKSLVWPGSSCPSCGAQIRWYDNVPLFAWLWLRGRCRACQARISARYPLVELLTALLSFALMLRFGPTGSYVVGFVFMLLLVALSFIDLDTWLIPDVISLPGIVLGIAGAWLLPERPVSDHALGAAVGGGLFWAVALIAKAIVKKEGMGLGDAKLLAMIGAFLGVASLLPVVLLSSIQGALIGSLWVYKKRHEPPPPPQEDGFVPPKTAVPFGPFLSLAALEYLFFSEEIHALMRLWVVR